MTQVQPPLSQTHRLFLLAPPVIAAGALAWFLFVAGPQGGLPFQPHAPDWALLARQTPVLQVHIAAALLALVIGLILLAGIKATRLHRTLGWGWVLAMATVAISSFFVRELNGGALSLVHLLSGWTVVILPMAVHAARRHEVVKHRGRMTGLFVGALVIAGLLTLFPGRLMWRVFLG
ncbi:DUF2306 domain-containing protein [Brevundimonas sp.]|uniref:DUF2306 domain-containing protein n=1 Tax=Brevundimonas sp. TaxID=1871086 RepID=UPI00286BC268|nr:DUF2306 domain-containing protein [Brevundimonas sp.]